MDPGDFFCLHEVSKGSTYRLMLYQMLRNTRCRVRDFAFPVARMRSVILPFIPRFIRIFKPIRIMGRFRKPTAACLNACRRSSWKTDALVPAAASFASAACLLTFSSEVLMLPSESAAAAADSEALIAFLSASSADFLAAAAFACAESLAVEANSIALLDSVFIAARASWMKPRTSSP